ncbi:MAG: hypothetical protein EON58_21665 [Alphaproteobacteria bacterium]|nr:MAG: hypothetical protein EON58_21665 [Alphaproteobacteria bacterium]
MNDETEDSLKHLGCEVLAKAGDSQVAIRGSVRKEYDALEAEQRGRFNRIMEMWCQHHKLPTTMFNYNEGRTQAEKIMLQ